MELTAKDKEYLEGHGYTEKDIDWIAWTARETATYWSGGEEITADEAIRLLGRESYLDCLALSALNWGCTVETLDGTEVSFDSRAFR